MTTITGENHVYTVDDISDSADVIIRTPQGPSDNDDFMFSAGGLLFDLIGVLSNTYNGFTLSKEIINNGTNNIVLYANGAGLNMLPVSDITIPVNQSILVKFIQQSASPIANVTVIVSGSTVGNTIRTVSESSTGQSVPSQATLIGASAAGTGFLTPLTVNPSGHLMTSGSFSLGDASYDAFSRIRVSNPATIFSSQCQYGSNLLVEYYHQSSFGGTFEHKPFEAAVLLTVTNAVNSAALRQTQRYFRYQPGKSQCVFITFDMRSSVSTGTKQVGYGDGLNGIFLRRTGATGITSVVRRKQNHTTGNAEDEVVNQTAWNIDKMDGSGPSGVTLNIGKSQILIIDLQWLAVGRVRIGFDINGIIYYVHYFTWANTGNSVYMTTANLPVRWEITGSGAADSMLAICVSIQSEGGVSEDRIASFFSLQPETLYTLNSTTSPSFTSPQKHIISIRPKQIFPAGSGIINRGEYEPYKSIILVSDFTALIQVYLSSPNNVTITAPNQFTSVADHSGMECLNNSGGTGSTVAFSTTGAILMLSNILSGRDGIQANDTETSKKLQLTLGINGEYTSSSMLTIVGITLGSAQNQAAKLYCILNWFESK
jgi:hypothetical protein